MTLGDRLKLVRKQIGLNQAELAEKLSISRPTLVTYEKDQSLIGIDAVVKLKNLCLGLNLDWLLTGEGEMLSSAQTATEENWKEKVDNELSLLWDEINKLKNMNK
jgi:transcriptional regulator with XRE-family HTH domain